MPAPMMATSTSSCEPASTEGVGSSSQNGVFTEAMLCEPAVDPVSFRRESCDVELGECRDHFTDGESCLSYELVRRRGQKVEDRIVVRRAPRRRLDSERFEDVGRCG